MSINVNLIEKFNKNESSIDDDAIIDILFKMIWASNPRRCVKSNKKSILVRNYFIDKKQDNWEKQTAIMTGLHPWSLIEKAEISLVNDDDLNLKTIIYRIDLQLHVFFVGFMSLAFGLFTGIILYNVNIYNLNGVFIGFSVFTFILFASFLNTIILLKRHKNTLSASIDKIKNRR